MRCGINPLDDGTLYVAKFNADGSGEWLPLTPGNPELAGWSLTDILINTRGAADAAGATKMDRPEWIDTFPDSLTAIATLTNNSSRRGTGTNPRTGVPRSGQCANPRTPKPTATSSVVATGTTGPSRRSAGTSSRSAAIPQSAAHGSTIIGDKYGSPDGHLRRAERPALDPDRRVGQHHQYGRLRRLRQQPDALRRSR